VADPVVVTPAVEPDPFDAAFAEFSSQADKPAVTAEDIRSDIAPVAKPVETPDDSLPPSGKDPVLTPVIEPEPVAEPKIPVDNSQDAETLRAFMDTLKQASKLPEQPRVQQPRVQQPAPEPEMFSPEEKTLLATYEKDWPDVRRGEALLRKAEYRDLLSYAFDQIGAQIRPMMATLQELSGRTHVADLESAVEDYADVRDKVVNWAQEQPGYLRNAYNHVIQQGTTEEVQHLIDTWRKQSGTVIPAAASVPVAPALTPAAKQAAARLAPVPSKRTNVSAGINPLDFDSAFATFAKQFDQS
jgi:hypothetical protein